MDITVYNRKKSKEEIEKVYGDKFIDWLYSSFSGKGLSALLVKAPASVLYGYLQSASLSHRKVLPFIEKFHINMDDYEYENGGTKEKPYSSFNNFFIRKFKENKRPFNPSLSILPAFSEARYFGYESIKDEETVPVKGKFLGAKELLASSKWEPIFNEGPLLLARLCPVDYHRFHFPDDGKVLDHYKIKGNLHSVNPLALKKKADIFTTNIREVSILETKNFGKLAYVEVGAMCVGKIVQSTGMNDFKRGDEKGYFLFGGSTVIVIGERGKWSPSKDLIDNTKNGLETYIQLGDEVGLK